MRGLGFIAMVLAGLFGIFALNMDTSVDSGSMFGRVNNIGLMNDKQNYLTIAGVIFIAGLLMAIFGGDDTVSEDKQNYVSNSNDPFDQIDEEELNKRKRYAVSLGIIRENGIYRYNDVSFIELDQAILLAESARKSMIDPAEHFLG